MPNDNAGKPRRGRRLFGLMLLGFVVFLWTASSFLQSSIFADDEFDKPYFVTYFNTCFFVLPLLPICVKRAYQRRKLKAMPLSRRASMNRTASFNSARSSDPERQSAGSRPVILKRASTGPVETTALLDEDPDSEDSISGGDAEYAHTSGPPLTVKQTAGVALKFCVVWFTANWFNSACLGYTSVASATILTSTSSIFTLIFSSMAKVEKFTLRKLFGVIMLMVGVMMTSSDDITGETNKHRGSFPHKEVGEIVLGDTLALVSAALYGVYATGLAKTIGDESRVNMLVFFGFVGLINLVMLWPGFIILHFVGIELFEFPPSGRILGVVLSNAVVSMSSDICWAYAMVMVSPLVVTVGLSLTIPLSLVGQMIINQQHASPLYWIGALVVVISFFFINNESRKTGEAAERAAALAETR